MSHSLEGPGRQDGTMIVTMKIANLRNMLAGLLAGFLLSGVAAAGPTGLLGVQLVSPTINFVGNGPADVIYDGISYSIDSTALRVTFYDGGPAESISNGDVTFIAAIDSLGLLGGGTFSVSGSVTDSLTSTPYSGILLSGTISDYGMLNLGRTDLSDFLLKATGGALKSIFDAVGPDVGAIMALEMSTFNGSFAQPWRAKLAKGNIGGIPLSEPGTFLLVALGLGLLMLLRPGLPASRITARP